MPVDDADDEFGTNALHTHTQAPSVTGNRYNATNLATAFTFADRGLQYACERCRTTTTSTHPGNDATSMRGVGVAIVVFDVAVCVVDDVVDTAFVAIDRFIAVVVATTLVGVVAAGVVVIVMVALVDVAAMALVVDVVAVALVEVVALVVDVDASRSRNCLCDEK